MFEPIQFGGYHRCHKAFVHFHWLCIRTFFAASVHTWMANLVCSLLIFSHRTPNASRYFECIVRLLVKYTILIHPAQPSASTRCHRGHTGRFTFTAQDTQQLRSNTNARIIEKECFFRTEKYCNSAERRSRFCFH